MQRVSFLLVMSALFSQLAAAQVQWRTPERGSAERAQVMDALRTKLGEFDSNASQLVFVVKELCVGDSKGWLSVEPQSRDGSNKFEPVQASLKRSKSLWTIEQLACAEADCAEGTDGHALRARVKPMCR